MPWSGATMFQPASVMQKKTRRPIQPEIAEQAEV
jgi:hypothetical protein